MNERIKELVKQCENTQTSYFDGRGNVTSTYFDREKFAELIIKECLEQVRDEIQYASDWQLADAVSNRVLEHFGVKQ